MRALFLTVLFGMASVCAVIAADAEQNGLELKSVSAQQVLTIKVDSLSDFPAAFEKLNDYCDSSESFRPILRMSLGRSREYYAAVAFEGTAPETSDVKILELPSATVATAIHRGSYYKLPGSVKRLMDAASAAGYAPDEEALLRLLHRNTPADGPAELLVTEIQLPVVKR